MISWLENTISWLRDFARSYNKGYCGQRDQVLCKFASRGKTVGYHRRYSWYWTQYTRKMIKLCSHYQLTKFHPIPMIPRPYGRVMGCLLWFRAEQGWFGMLPGSSSLRWRHNDHAGVSNHQPHGCLLNRLFRRKSKITSKLRVTGLCAGNSPGTGEFPAQMASYAENVSIWWRHHDTPVSRTGFALFGPGLIALTAPSSIHIIFLKLMFWGQSGFLNV